MSAGPTPPGRARASLDAARRAVELEAGRGDGSVRDADPETLARGIELIARGFVLARDPGLDAWTELSRAVEGYLKP